MSSYREEYQNAAWMLEAAAVPDAAVDAWYLFEYVTKLNRASYLLKAADRMPEEECRQYAELLIKRCERIPLQYLTGVQEFMGLEFKVSPSTLIPRQDTEILVEEVMKYAAGKRVLDLCTGTGCIIISLAKLAKPAYALGTDISGEAVATARENAKALEAEAEFYAGDLYEAVPEKMQFDIIVSNPPYIPSDVIDTLMPEVREHEPMTALDGDKDGLKFYRAIIADAHRYLAKDGRLFFEIGHDQAAALESLLKEQGYEEIRILQDYAGLDRVVCARRS